MGVTISATGKRTSAAVVSVAVVVAMEGDSSEGDRSSGVGGKGFTL